MQAAFSLGAYETKVKENKIRTRGILLDSALSPALPTIDLDRLANSSNREISLHWLVEFIQWAPRDSNPDSSAYEAGALPLS